MRIDMCHQQIIGKSRTWYGFLTTLLCCAAVWSGGSLISQAQPTNDNFFAAALIDDTQGIGSIMGNNTGATFEFGEPEHVGPARVSVWYAWIPPRGGLAILDTSGSSIDTVIAAYVGFDFNSMVQLAANDDGSGPGSPSMIEFPVIRNSIYYIAVDSAIAEEGDFTLNWIVLVPNDNFADAQEIFGENGTVFGDSEFASTETFEPDHVGPPNASVWYRWTAPADGNVTFDTFGSGFNTVLAAYEGTEIDELIQLAANDDDFGIGEASSISFPVVSGQEYYIAVDGANMEFGFIELTWNLRPSITDPNAEFSFIRFSNFSYTVTEDEGIIFTDPDDSDTNGDNPRDVRGANITVIREGSLVGRVLVDYRVFDTPLTWTSNYFEITTNMMGMSVTNMGSVEITEPSANPGGDYSPVRGTLVFDHLQSRADFLIPVHSNIGNRTNRQVFANIVLRNARAAQEEDSQYIVPQASDSARLNILQVRDYRKQFSIQRAVYRVDEDDANLEVTVVLPGGGTNGVSVVIETEDIRDSDALLYDFPLLPGSDYADHQDRVLNDSRYTDGSLRQTNRMDYTGFSQQLNFGRNVVMRTIRIPFSIDDPDVEFNEDVRIRLRDPEDPDEGYGIFHGNATVTILNDDQPAGALDREWNPDNVVLTPFPLNKAPGANGEVFALQVQPDQKTLIAGDFTSYNTVPRNHIARINPDGTTDFTFDPGTGPDAFVEAMMIYPASAGANAGKILIGGAFSSVNNLARNGLARLNPNGSLDATFTTGSGFNGVVRDVSIGLDGSIVTVGDFTTFNGVGRRGVARLNDDGSLDTNFAPSTGLNGMAWAVAENGSGIYVGGEFTQVNGVGRNGLARLNFNGTLDTSFQPGDGVDGPVYGLVIQPDSKILVGGNFSNYDFRPRKALVRINDDGSIDPTFRVGKGADGPVYHITLQPDGKPVLGGGFTYYDGVRRLGLARLFVDGSLDTSFMDTAYNHFAGIVKPLSVDPALAVNALAMQTNGDFMIGGNFKSVGGNPSYEIVDTNLWRVVIRDRAVAFNPIWTRQDKRARYNVARILGGRTPGPGNATLVFDEYFADENSGSLAVEVERVNGRLGSLFANISTEDRVAKAGQDYGSFGTGVFWEQSWLVDVPESIGRPSERFGFISITDDSLVEGNETFALTLDNTYADIYLGGENIIMGGAPGKFEAPVTIVDNDFKHGVIAFSSPTYTVLENEVEAVINVSRTNGTVGAVQVEYSTFAGSATPNVDYTPKTGKIIFSPGQTSQTIRIPILDESLVELDETFSLVLTNASGGATFPQSASSQTATITIIDDDFAPGHVNLLADTFSVSEDAGLAHITLVRTGGSIGQVSVRVRTVAGSGPGFASDPEDFSGIDQMVVWPHGDKSARIVSIPVFHESPAEVEGTETVTVELYMASLPGLINQIPTATLQILDADFYGTFSFSQPVFESDENGGPAQITVTRLQGLAGTVQVNYEVVVDATGTNAAANTEFTATTGTLTFASGQTAKTFPVDVLDDTVADGDKTIRLNLTSTDLGDLGDPSTAVLTVVDNESFNAPAGSLDPSFNITAGANETVSDLALQPDGSLLVAGSFTRLNGVTKSRIGRLTPRGDLDNTFNLGLGPDDTVTSMALQPDGKVVIGGFFSTVQGTNRNYLARLNGDGTVDTFFNPGIGPDNPVNALALTDNGNVLVGGTFAFYNGLPSPYFAMVNSDGTLISNPNIGTGPNGDVLTIAVQRDGKILIGGDFTMVNNVPYNRLARLNADGSLDRNFDPGDGADGSILVIQPELDGNILVGGSFTTFDGVSQNYITRLRPDGSLDDSFPSSGLNGANGPVFDIAIQLDSKLIVCGDFGIFNGVTRNRITRLNQDGSTDPTINFGSGADAFIAKAVIQPDRKIIIGGAFTMFNQKSRQRLARLNGGSLAGSGAVEFSKPVFSTLEAQDQAEIFVRRVGGTLGAISVDFSTIPGSATEGVDYEAASGTLSFPEGETLAVLNIPLFDDAEVEPDESVLVILQIPGDGGGGVVLGPQPVATLNIISDDSLIEFQAPSYTVNEGVSGGNAVIGVKRTGFLGFVSVGYLTADGTALAGSDYQTVNGSITFDVGESNKTFLVPIINDQQVEDRETLTLLLTNTVGNASLGLASASLQIIDNDFGPGVLFFQTNIFVIAESAGVVPITVLRTNGSTGRILVDFATLVGSATPLVDYAPTNGTISFAEGQTSQTFVIPILPDSLVEGDEFFFINLTNVLGGATFAGPMTARILIQDDEFGPGSLDKSFDPGGGANNFVRTLAVQSDGGIVLGGAFTEFDSLPRNYITRLEANGAQDLTFDPGVGANGSVSSLQVQSDGKIVLGGSFTQVGGVNFNRVGRLGRFGLVDQNFQMSSGLDGSVNAVSVHTNNAIVLGGGFNLPTRGVVQLKANGTIDNAFNPGLGPNGLVHTATYLSDGTIALGGAFSTVNGVSRTKVARLLANGTLDSSFVPPTLSSGTVFDIHAQPDGRLILAGDFTVQNWPGIKGLARLNQNGSLDTSFNPLVTANDVVYAVDELSNGKIVVGGSFTLINGVSRNRFALLQANGEIDAEFDPGIGANNIVYDLEVLPSDDIIIVGNFSEVSGTRRNGVAKVFGASSMGGTFDILDFSLNAGQATIRITSEPGRTYVLEGSTNFINWIGVQTTQATSTTLDLIDSSANSFPQRFYRVRVP